MLRRYYIFSSLLIFIVCAVLAQSIFFPRIKNISLDLLFRVRGEKVTSQEIVIIGIDEESLEDLGPWPFSRDTHAQLLDRLKLAKSIGFDLLLTQPEPLDQVFIDAIDRAPPVTFPLARDYRGQLLMPPENYIDHVSIGHIDSSLGNDGVVREIEFNRHAYDVFSLAMLSAAAVKSPKFEKDNQTAIINFYGPEFTFLYLSYNQVINGQYSEEMFRDRYVLVGSKAIALGDVHVTPFSRKHPVPGVEIQATILNNFLDDNFITEQKWIAYLLCAIPLLCACLVWPESREKHNLSLVFLSAAIIVGLTFVSFNYLNIFVDPSLPLVVLLLSYFSHLLSQLFWLTAKLIKEMRELDDQLAQGIQDYYQTVPSQLKIKNKLAHNSVLPGGIKRHFNQIHNGIQALSLQNSFINHLLSRETPPLILWQADTGYVIFANSGFKNIWAELSDANLGLPVLSDFSSWLNSNKTDDIDDFDLLAMGGSDAVDSDYVVDICASSGHGKTYFRVIVHVVTNDILGFSGIISSFTNVTEIKELERIKGEMMNIVSHELKLPLTSILGFGEMLSGQLKGQEKQYADEICDQSKRLAQMIEDFLDISRLESGRYAVNKFPFDLITSAHDAISCVQSTAGKRNITIKSEFPAKVSPLLGDEVLITQAVINLLDNAVKFSPNDTVVLISVEENEKALILKVTDHGSGMEENGQDKIFEKFFRGRHKGDVSGFGLGLNFVKQVIDNHNGKVRAENNEKCGASFIITMFKS